MRLVQAETSAKTNKIRLKMCKDLPNVPIDKIIPEIPDRLISARLNDGLSLSIFLCVYGHSFYLQHLRNSNKMCKTFGGNLNTGSSNKFGNML